MKYLFLILLVGCFSIVEATNRYTAKTGNNSNDGSFGSPYLTITKGLSVSAAGDTLFVMTGTYQEYINPTVSGTSGHPIVVKRYGTDDVIIDAQNSRNYCIYALNINYVIIDGLNCINATDMGVYIYECSNFEIRNNTITFPIYTPYASGTGRGVFLTGSANWANNIILRNVTSSGSQYPLLIGSKVNGVNIIGGRYSYGSIDGINIQKSGMTISDTATISRNILIDGTEIDHNLRQGINTWGVKKLKGQGFWVHDNDASGVQIENFSYNITLQDFISENNCRGAGWTFETGIWIDDTDSCTIRRGIMRGNSTGLRVAHSQNVLAYNLLIYSNTYTTEGTTINNSAGVDLVYDAPTGDGNSMYVTTAKLYNSVIYGNGNQYSQRASINLRGAGNYTLKNNIISNGLATIDMFIYGSPTYSSDYNLFYNSRTLSIFNNTGNISWETYKATGKDTHSLNNNPLLSNPNGYDFKLQSTSPAINAGVSVGLTTDFLNNNIVGIPDIGAYEYISEGHPHYVSKGKIVVSKGKLYY